MPFEYIQRTPMLELHNLDGQSYIIPVYVLGWRFIEDEEGDQWSRRFLSFKDGIEAAVRGACAVFPEAIKATLNIDKKPILLVSASSSSDSCLRSGAPLYRLGSAIGEYMEWEWRPDLLKHKPHKPLHTIRGYPGETASQRDSEISGKYSCNSVSGEYKGIFILDDLCTRGATVSEIARALKTQLKNIPIWGLALAKNDRKRYGY
jgi:hypothetical protein